MYNPAGPAVSATQLAQAAGQPVQSAPSGNPTPPGHGLPGGRTNSSMWRGSTAQGVCMWIAGITGVLSLVLALTGFTLVSILKPGGGESDRNGTFPTPSPSPGSVFCSAIPTKSGGLGVENCTSVQVDPKSSNPSSITCLGSVENGFYCLGKWNCIPMSQPNVYICKTHNPLSPNPAPTNPVPTPDPSGIPFPPALLPPPPVQLVPLPPGASSSKATAWYIGSSIVLGVGAILTVIAGLIWKKHTDAASAGTKPGDSSR